MTIAKNGVEVLDFSGLAELVPRTPKLIKDLGLFGEPTFGQTTIGTFERVEEGTDEIKAQARGGDRNFAGREKVISRNFNKAFYPLDAKFTPNDIQDLREWGTSDTPASVEGRVDRIMTRTERSHANLLEKAMYAAIKGTSYSANWEQGQYNYADEFGVTGKVTTADVDFTDLTTDPRAVIEAQARAHIIDNAMDNGDAYRVIALVGRQYFSALVSHDLVVDAYNKYSSEQEPLRKRLNGDSINRMFETDGVLYIEDISGQIGTGEAYILPLGIEDMFQLDYAPAYTIKEANQTAKEMYVYMVSDGHRTETIETETSFIAVNTRPELVVKSTGNF